VLSSIISPTESSFCEVKTQAPFSKGTSHPALPERVQAIGIENLYRLSPRLYSGAQPEGKAGFTSLNRLGIKTIISVDGARPDIEEAHRLGMRYAHLPFGYDGPPRERCVQLVKAIQFLPGAVFVHCHHGKHRGPTVASICGVSCEGWNRDQAVAWLKQVGTSPDYRGLYEAVECFIPPSTDELAGVLPADLPERARVPGLVEAMVDIDKHWDNLKAIQKAGFRTPPGSPDVDSPHEALMLVEQFREALRQGKAKSRGEEFTRLLDASHRDSTTLETALRELRGGTTPTALANVEDTFRRVGRRCSACHAKFRDR